MWNLWFFGNDRDKIGPYRFISPKFDLPNVLCKTNISRTNKVINAILDIAVEANQIENRNDVTNLNSQTVFDFAFPKFVEALYTRPSPRPQEININTLANKMCRNKA